MIADRWVHLGCLAWVWPELKKRVWNNWFHISFHQFYHAKNRKYPFNRCIVWQLIFKFPVFATENYQLCSNIHKTDNAGDSILRHMRGKNIILLWVLTHPLHQTSGPFNLHTWVIRGVNLTWWSSEVTYRLNCNVHFGQWFKYILPLFCVFILVLHVFFLTYSKIQSCLIEYWWRPFYRDFHI